METVTSIVPLLAIGVSTLAALMIVVFRNSPDIRDGCSIAAAVAQFGFVISMVPLIQDGKVIEYHLMNLGPALPNAGFNLRVDGLGFLFGAIASFLWILTTIYSIGYMRGLKEHSQTRYFACFALALTGALGVAFSADLLTLFLFYELLSFVTWPLVIHHETAEAYSGGKKYLTYLVGSAKLFLLPAIIFTYSFAGTLTFKHGGIFPVDVNPLWITAIFVLFLAGIVKAGIMPFHNWLPTAMVAPTPVSALLHAVAVVKVGVFSVVRIALDVFGVDTLTRLNIGIPAALFASATVLLASIIALKQDNLKARLAYSTVSQLSYVILGVMLLTPDGIKGSVMQIAAHAFGKITLFFCAGAIYVALHKKNISELSGMGKKMPWTFAAFTVGALSLIGVPPLAGFMSKWWLAVGSIQANSLLILFVLLSSALLNAAYFLPIIYKAYFGAPAGTVGAAASTERQEAPMTMVVPLLVTAVGTLMVGLYSGFIMDLVKRVIDVK